MARLGDPLVGPYAEPNTLTLNLKDINEIPKDLKLGNGMVMVILESSVTKGQ